MIYSKLNFTTIPYYFVVSSDFIWTNYNTILSIFFIIENYLATIIGQSNSMSIRLDKRS